MALEKNWQEHRYEVAKQCRYLLQKPASLSATPTLIVALHGYGQNPEDMLRLTRLVVGKDEIIASLAGPNEQFLEPNLASSTVGYNWGTRNHWDEAVRLHHSMLNIVLSTLPSDLGIPSARTLLFGYSQSVGLNYRFAGTYPNAIGAVVGICGGDPKDWEESKYQRLTAPILHISRDQDEFFPAEVAAGFKQRLESHATDVTFRMIEGPHRFPSKAGEIIVPWMDRVYA